MNIFNQVIILIFSTFILNKCTTHPAQKQLDGFESLEGWQTIVSDETVEINTETVSGKTQNALKMEFDFTNGTGFCGIQKQFSLTLPDNFQFTFYLKGEAPPNNFEFKLLDKSGDNVWWFNQRNFKFGKEWRKIVIKKRHIEFAWGPIENKSLKQIDKIQFFIASSVGGSGSVYLDDFKFEELAVPDTVPPQPIALGSSEQMKFPSKYIFDDDPNSSWRNAVDDINPEIIIDLQKHYEYGGLVIDWNDEDYAKSYDVLVSHDTQNWEMAYQVSNGKGRRSYIPLKDSESRYLKLKLYESSNPGMFAINEISIKEFSFFESTETMYREINKDNPRGYYPRYFSDEQSYWTITGVNNDYDEALINEDGMVEVDKSMFSIEPFIYSAEKFFTWNDVISSQHLEKNYLPVPSVKWHAEGLELESKIFVDGEAGESILYLIYTLKNYSDKSRTGNLFLAVRPFQVNPPWQFLNWPGGTAKIKSIKRSQKKIDVNGNKSIFTLSEPDGFGAAEFDEGDITSFISQNRLPQHQNVKDHLGYASAALKYQFNLSPGQVKKVVLAVPFHESSEYVVSQEKVANRLKIVKEFWERKVNTVQFSLPKSADRLINALRSNIAYILINRDGLGIQPGSRSYERSWIRDGSLTSSALLKMGIKEEVKDFVNWYSDYQYQNGMVPCVVDSRGADPTAEHDSHGQLIFALRQYYLFTGDKAFLEEHFENVQRSIDFMNQLTAQRRTDVYKNGDATQQACYGLLPESISHEGYSAKAMHSYWDDFFGLKGYKDAVQIATVIGKPEHAELFAAARDTFQNNLYNSINSVVKNKNINYIPGCVELGDFDATSTAIAIYPCNELNNLPQPFAQNTFDRYYHYFSERRDNKIDWRDYTPYEVRLIGTFIYLGQIERAHALIDFFFKDQRPAGWNHWAEVVRKGYRTSGFIGDMPHTWVGSDFINSFRSMFVYEDELNQALVIGAGLYQDWVDDPNGISVMNLPTYYGDLNYRIKKSNQEYIVNLWGSVHLPDGNLILKNLRKEKPKNVFVNGVGITDFDIKKIVIKQFPAEVRVMY